jgi:diguanylate cyclase (GGDEF)-like protein/PAS domain S-box-containing protein
MLHRSEISMSSVDDALEPPMAPLARHAPARPSQERYRQFYESTPAMLHSIDMNGVLVSVSDAWLAKLGYSREEVIGRRSVEFLTARSRDHATRNVLPSFFQKGHCDEVEYEMVTRSGEVIEVLLSAVLEFDESGRPAHTTAVIQDVTQRRRAERALREERQHLAYIIEGTHAGTWEWNIQTGETRFNEQWAQIIGFTLKELEPVTMDIWLDRAHPKDLLRSEQILARHYAGALPAYECQVRLRHRGGHWIWILSRGRVQTWTPDGRPEWMFGFDIDISHLKDQEEALRQSQAELSEQHELLRVTLRSIGDAVITTNADGEVIWLNPVAETMTGWSTQAASRRPLDSVFHIVNADTGARVQSPVSVCLEQTPASGSEDPTVLISRNGDRYGIEHSASPIRSDKGEVLGLVLVFHDVTEQRRVAGELNYRATHDALTGLVNRQEFESRLRGLLQNTRDQRGEHALLYLDLDQFKLVNDACGHAIGDQLLQQVARLFSETVRARDTLARLGGDEFAILLEHCSMTHAERIAAQICERVGHFRFSHDGRSFRIGVSIGLAPVLQRWSSVASLMQAADVCCYAAKQAGRNRVQVWHDSDTGIRRHQGETQWALRIEHALEENRFVLHAQRIVGLKDSPEGPADGIYAEALLRMIDDTGREVLPGAFLPAAERFHLASRIDRWVLNEAVSWLEDLQAPQSLRTLSVNLSGQSIGDRAFHRYAMDLLGAAGESVCSRLCLEITETAAVTNIADAAVFVKNVKALGVHTALDDFGSGASSFGYLKALPVDFLKIDGQFIQRLLDDRLNQAAVRCFVEVASVVGVKTVAEFVDGPRLLEMVRSLGVDFAQGFLLHRPAPIRELLPQSMSTTRGARADSPA